ncbi:hypothetical protein TNCV_1168951 [Trichonephila clavipes]|uniref:Uncharacterized protein n=1 Tax=Trichonephila clavipes TaxID=2585209 RepID=A0A8X6T0U6_TRICX|nr:hypothetical protein TNCV_1168951 [Trichonephila clavipes]
MNRYTNAKLADIPLRQKFTCRCSVAWRTISSVAANVSSNPRSDASEHGCFIAMIEDTLVNSEMNWCYEYPSLLLRSMKRSVIFEYVLQSMSHRCRACIHANDSNFKHLL